MFVSSQPSGIAFDSGIAPHSYFDRLDADIKDLYFQYTYIPLLASFLDKCSEVLLKLDIPSLVLGARILNAIKKCMSGLEYEFPEGITVSQELFLLKLRVLVFNQQETFLQQISKPNTNTVENNGTVLLLPHETEEILETIEKWLIFEQLLYSNSYTSLLGLNDKIVLLLSTCVFAKV